MHFRLTSLLVAMLAVFLAPVAAHAVSIQLSLQYVGSFKSDFSTPAGYTLGGAPVDRTLIKPDDVQQYELFATVNTTGAVVTGTGTAALQYLQLDVNGGTGWSAYPSTGYAGDLSVNIDPPPPGPAGGGSGPLFSTNQDAGTAFDLKDITAITNRAQATASNGHPGENLAGGLVGPVHLGTLYLSLNGAQIPAAQTSTNYSIGPTAVPGNFFLWNGSAGTPSGIDETSAVTAGSSASVVVAVTPVPEPATIALMGLAGIGLLVVRRRSR